jgi:hypothetical protein
MNSINEVRKHNIYYFHSLSCQSKKINFFNCCKGNFNLILEKKDNKILRVPLIKTEKKINECDYRNWLIKWIPKKVMPEENWFFNLYKLNSFSLKSKTEIENIVLNYPDSFVSESDIVYIYKNISILADRGKENDITFEEVIISKLINKIFTSFNL